jgi:hypothetical protein
MATNKYNQFSMLKISGRELWITRFMNSKMFEATVNSANITYNLLNKLLLSEHVKYVHICPIKKDRQKFNHVPRLAIHQAN